MGSSLTCSSENGNVKTGNQNHNNHRRLPNSVTCNCKRARDVTHFNTTSNEFLCSTCYQTVKRNKKTDMRNVHNISSYMKTLAFRQQVTKLNKNARLLEGRCCSILTHYQQTKRVLETKRSGLLNEVKTFIQDLVDLLKHMQEELCDEIDREIDRKLAKTDDLNDSIQRSLNKLRQHKMTFENSQNNNTFHSTQNLNSMVELDAILVETNRKTEKYYDFVPKLRVNKSLKLEDVFGSRSGSRRIKLGKFIIDTNMLESSAVLVETLDDVTDESSVCTTPDSTIDRAPSTFSSRGKSREESRLQTATPAKSNPATLLSASPKQGTSNTRPYQESPLNLDGRQSGVFSRGEPSVSNARALSRVSSKRVSFPEHDYKAEGDISRRSTVSILSPGKLDTPVFMTPTPRPTFSSDVENAKITLAKVVPLRKDVYVPNITSSAILGNGLIVLCDQQNMSLALYDENFLNIDIQKFQSYPHNVTEVRDYGVSATFPTEKVVRFLKIEQRKFCDVEANDVKSPCYGIAIAEDDVMYTTGKLNEVNVFKRRDDRKRTWKFQYAFHQPLSLYFDRWSNHLFVTCFGMKDAPGRVVKMNFYKQAVDMETNSPEIVKPVCSVLDASGYIYVCDVKPHAVHQLTPAGDYVRKIIGGNDGQIQHINFLPNKNFFFATEHNSDKVKIFKME